MLITPMRRRGIVPTPQERRQSLAVKGDVRVTCVQDPVWTERPILPR